MLAWWKEAYLRACMLHLTLPEFLISHPDIWPITVFFLSRVWSLQFCHEAHFLLYEKYSIAIIGYKISIWNVLSITEGYSGHVSLEKGKDLNKMMLALSKYLFVNITFSTLKVQAKHKNLSLVSPYTCNRGTQFCVTTGSKLIFTSIQTRELGQCPYYLIRTLVWFEIPGLLLLCIKQRLINNLFFSDHKKIPKLMSVTQKRLPSAVMQGMR